MGQSLNGPVKYTQRRPPDCCSSITTTEKEATRQRTNVVDGAGKQQKDKEEKRDQEEDKSQAGRKMRRYEEMPPKSEFCTKRRECLSLRPIPSIPSAPSGLTQSQRTQLGEPTTASPQPLPCLALPGLPPGPSNPTITSHRIGDLSPNTVCSYHGVIQPAVSVQSAAAAYTIPCVVQAKPRRPLAS